MTEQKIDQAQLQAVMAQHQNMANAQVGTVVREAMAAAFRYGVEAPDLGNEVAAQKAEAVRLRGELKRVNTNSQELIAKCDALIEQAEDDKAHIEGIGRTLERKDREISALKERIANLEFGGLDDDGKA